MGQYAYLINKENRISCEAFKISGSGEDSLVIESTDQLVRFMHYCLENKLSVECVSEHWFSEKIDLEIEEPYKDFE